MKILGEASGDEQARCIWRLSSSITRVRVGDQGASRISEWSSSHPLSEHRVEDITTWLKQQYPRGVPREQRCSAPTLAATASARHLITRFDV